MASPGRRLLASANLLLTVGLLAMLFILINYISSRRYARWDVTAQQIHTLSDHTVQTLRSTESPLRIIVFYQPTHRLYTLIKDLLKEYERITPQLTVEYVDPEKDIARANQLAKQFQIEDLNLVVFQAGDRHTLLSDSELAEYDYTPLQSGGLPRVQAFKGENAFTSAMISITQLDAPTVWFTTGHGERSAESEETTAVSALRTTLAKQGMTVTPATLAGLTEIPAEVKAVAVIGPTHRFADPEVQLLQAYLERGGRLLVLIDPLDDPGLDELLARWGVTVGDDIVVDPGRQLPFVSAANLLITDYTQHPIVEKMKTLVTLYPMARSVRPIEPAPAGLSVTPLALTSESGWGETETASTTFTLDEETDLVGPVSIAVASERPAAPEDPEAAAVIPRLVVIGDADFVTNSQLGNVGNRDILLGAVYWLIEEEQLIGIGPKPIASIKLSLTKAQLRRTLWFSMLAMPLLCGLAGLGMWGVRRR